MLSLCSPTGEVLFAQLGYTGKVTSMKPVRYLGSIMYFFTNLAQPKKIYQNSDQLCYTFNVEDISILQLPY